MTDETPNRTPEDDPFAQDGSAAHRFVADQTGSGKTTRFTSWHRSHSDESTNQTNPKGDDVDVADGSDD